MKNTIMIISLILKLQNQLLSSNEYCLSLKTYHCIFNLYETSPQSKNTIQPKSPITQPDQ